VFYDEVLVSTVIAHSFNVFKLKRSLILSPATLFSLTFSVSFFPLILPAALGSGVHPASNRNDYLKQKNNNVSGQQSAPGAYR
jgi:hypothetical protein